MPTSYRRQSRPGGGCGGHGRRRGAPACACGRAACAGTYRPGATDAVGRLAALIYRSQPADSGFPTLFGVTGTNGKTTTTYFINSLLRALGKKPGLIGTIEIVAGGGADPPAS